MPDDVNGPILPPDRMRASAEAQVLVVGAGACGMVAGLAAAQAGADVLLLERDRTPSGSTALSSGFIPAPGTWFQRAAGVDDDSPALFAADILAKSHGSADAQEALRVATAIGPALEWLARDHGLEFAVLTDFLYPGHARHRMHAVPERTGAGLVARLSAAVAALSIPVLAQARAEALFADAAGRVHGARVRRPDGSNEDVACAALVLACGGYGGAPALVRRHVPALAEALYFGHAGHQGEALAWGAALGADARDLSACQGHGAVAHPHGVLVTWALPMQGAIQVNAHGERFWNEHEGYSEAALAVLAQPGGVAWLVFDARRDALGQTFPDYRTADAAGAVRRAGDITTLAALCGLPDAALARTLADCRALAEAGGTDAFGRHFATPALAPPYCAVRVTGALFHTQGGLVVDDRARVLRPDGSALPNLFAGGGAARGVSGAHLSGYLSGNGLLTAVAYGRLAGLAAAAP